MDNFLDVNGQRVPRCCVVPAMRAACVIAVASVGGRAERRAVVLTEEQQSIKRRAKVQQRTAAEATVPPPGCKCKNECSAAAGGTCALETAADMAACPWASNYNNDYYMVSCVDPHRARVIADFSRFGGPAGRTAPTSVLPCLGYNLGSPGVTNNHNGWDPDPDISPCFFPEVTAAYKTATAQGAYAGQVPVTVKLRVHVFDDTGLTYGEPSDATTPPTAATATPSVAATSAADSWCVGSKPDQYGSCVCDGENGCQGSECSRHAGCCSWYTQACPDCKCTPAPPSGPAPQPTKAKFNQAMWEQAVKDVNDRNMFQFIRFTAGQFNAKAPAQAEWTKWTTKGFTTDMADIRWLYDFFGVPRGKSTDPAVGPHTMSEYVELFVLPKFTSVGYAMRRGNYNLSPAMFITESTMVRRGGAWNTLAHELGHIFGLHHTFNNLLLKDVQKSTCDSCVPTNSNGETTGDGIADTPATSSYYVNGKLNPKPEEATYNTDDCTLSFDSSKYCVTLPGGEGNMRNLMSYDDESCRATFTATQVARMRCWVDQDYGQTHIPDLPPGVVTLTATATSPTTVLLEWLPDVSDVWCTRAAGCLKEYRIERKQAGGEVTRHTGQPSARQYTDANVQPGEQYQFRVLAVDLAGREGAGVWVAVSTPLTHAPTDPPPPPSTATPTAGTGAPTDAGPPPTPPASGCSGGAPDANGMCVCAGGESACKGSGCSRCCGMSWYSPWDGWVGCQDCKCSAPSVPASTHAAARVDNNKAALAAAPGEEDDRVWEGWSVVGPALIAVAAVACCGLAVMSIAWYRAWKERNEWREKDNSASPRADDGAPAAGSPNAKSPYRAAGADGAEMGARGPPNDAQPSV